MTKSICLRFAVSFLLMHSTCCGKAEAQVIALMEDGHSFEIEMEQTQTEVKAGWKIIDINLKSKWKRYIWGSCARQYTTSTQPQFVVNTDTLQLSNLALIRMKTKKEYRSIPKPDILQNRHTMVDLNTFSIEPYGEEAFLIQPLQPLAPGEYIFTWTTAPTIGDLQDWLVWPFSIR